MGVVIFDGEQFTTGKFYCLFDGGWVHWFD